MWLACLLASGACTGGRIDGPRVDAGGGEVAAGRIGEPGWDAAAPEVWLVKGSPDAGTEMDAGSATGSESCGNEICARGMRCELSNAGVGSCVSNTCDDLSCGAQERCATVAAGAYCEDNSCSAHVDCAAQEYCAEASATCEADVCEPNATECDDAGQVVYACDSAGSTRSARFTCESAGGAFASACVTLDVGEAGCSCLDDWDCPAHTRCEAGVCQGAGQAASCALPPALFTDVLPTPEITWGGVPGAVSALQASLAPLSPPVADGRSTVAYPAYSQVVQTPLVINLDDDNGDGNIDERDFSEIVFTTFAGSAYTQNGVLRAIHGGGPNKGGDAFATCGTEVWAEGSDPAAVSCDDARADLDSTASLAAGDINGDGVPEIVGILESDAVRVFNNRGEVLATSETFSIGGQNPAPALVNLDGEGLAEVVVGRHVLTLSVDEAGAWSFVDRFSGSGPDSTSAGQGAVGCVADLIGAGLPQVISGIVAYSFPEPPAGVTRRDECAGGDTSDFCQGLLTVVWDAAALNGLSGDATRGMCAVADVLGADALSAPGPDNPLDGKPELITIEDESVRIFSGASGELLRTLALGSGGRDGGPPNVDDFDGDGFPEIGSAFEFAYAVFDLQQPTVGGACDAWETAPANDGTSALELNPARTPPEQSCTTHSDCGDTAVFGCNATVGRCVCLHNGWRRATEDNSSRVTGSSVFDFNGDGAAEVVYNDECQFRIYDGLNADVLFSESSESRTRVEYPVVADVDNDGNAEIVFGVSNESGFCSAKETALYNNGIEVWGDASDTWVSARRVWNQHAYHITNITESGGIPRVEPDSWGTYQGRTYNSYRSNPRSFGVAPDLTPTALQVSSPGAGCDRLSDELVITARVLNQGDLRVGPGVVVSFYGSWEDEGLDEALLDPEGQPLATVLENSLEPGDAVFLTVAYNVESNTPARLPDRIAVRVDDGDRERECVEDNNTLEVPLEIAEPLADLAVNFVTQPDGCPAPELQVQVCNLGAVAAEDVRVRFYAGDPAVGGATLAEAGLAAILAAGDCETLDVTLDAFPSGGSVIVFAEVDPDDLVPECADGNNRAAAADGLMCGGLL